MTLDLLLVASGGAGVGLGHVMRSAEIAREARSRGLRCAVALRGDAAAREALAKALPGLDAGDWHGPTDVAGRAPWTVFDTRDALDAELGAVARAGGRSVVLDRTDHRDGATWTVLPVLHADGPHHPRVLAGAPWCIVPEAVRRAAPPPDDTRDVLLVTLGGADPRGLTERVAAPLAEALGPGHGAVCAVVGPAFARRAERAHALAELGFRVLEAPGRDEMVAWMRRAWGAVVGFGTAVLELGFLGVPMVHVAHHGEDAAGAVRLAARGVGASAGFGGALEPAAFGALLRRTLLDPAWRRDAAQRGREQVGQGRGAAHLIDLVTHGTTAP